MKVFLKLIVWIMVVMSAVLIISCGAKKTEIKKELKASEIVNEETKTIIEKNETKETLKKIESLNYLSEDINLTADEIIIQEGSKTTTIKNPVLSNKKAESNKTVIKESNIATMQEKETVTRSFERINEVIKSTKKQKERKQFDFGLLLFQMLSVVIALCLIYFIWKGVKKNSHFN